MKKQEGVTLLELILVLVLASAISVVAFPRIDITNSNLKPKAEQLAINISFMAMQEFNKEFQNSDIQMLYNNETHSYDIWIDGEKSKNPLHSLSDSFSLEKVNAPPVIQIPSDDVDIITISNSNNSSDICIYPTGFAEICWLRRQLWNKKASL